MSKKNSKRTKKSDGQNYIIEPPAKRILILPQTLIKPMSPFQKRMTDLTFQIPPLGTPEAAALQQTMDMDISFQLKLKELKRKLSFLVNARLNDGSGFQLSNIFRMYFIEYLNRLHKYGPEAFPTSFNVVESFMSFDRKYMFFDLHKEIEHLLYINDYFLWYESGDFPKDPQVLKDIMSENTIYSYEMVSDSASSRIQCESQQVFAGIALIRHEYELSCLLLSGENPPRHSDEVVSSDLSEVAAPGRHVISAAPELSVKDRYLEGYPGYAKVIVLTRCDLRARKHDVRYVNLDIGRGFEVLTDDPTIYRDLSLEDAIGLQQSALEGLERYNNLFGALTSMIYLPAFFIAHTDKIRKLQVITKLHSERKIKKYKQLIKEIGEDKCVFHRDIKCMPLLFGKQEKHDIQVKPPELEFKCDGFWKPIGPLEIGEDKEGNPVVGRTWVSRHESWSAKSPTTFLIQQNITMPDGPDPGSIYIMRSGSHDIDIYKIGLTRQTVEARASELSSKTATPLPFVVLANWNVGDCASIERDIHLRLAAFRINPNKEFFRAKLSMICKIIGAIVNNYGYA